MAKTDSQHESVVREVSCSSVNDMAAKPLVLRSRLASYEIGDSIGSGSYGSVNEAYDPSRQRLVAIKQVKHMLEDLVDSKRILREIAILSNLDSPRVVKLYDVFFPHTANTFSKLFIVMEICDSDLKKLCRTEARFLPCHIYTMMYNLLCGLKYIHSAGVCHRDLKPANVFVNQDCSIKIGDFGLARVMGGGPDKNEPVLDDRDGHKMKRTLTGHVVTRWYRAPELILLRDDYTTAIDVWSAGCIFAELLSLLEDIKPRDRQPLFPGTSCFPLSPLQRHKNDTHACDLRTSEQLNLIFNVLGTPSDNDLEDVEANVRRYVRCYQERKGSGLQARFKVAHADALDLLDGLLKFSPACRTGIAEALSHKLFATIRKIDLELTAPECFEEPAFEMEADIDEVLLRSFIAEEVHRLQSRRAGRINGAAGGA